MLQRVAGVLQRVTAHNRRVTACYNGLRAGYSVFQDVTDVSQRVTACYRSVTGVFQACYRVLQACYGRVTACFSVLQRVTTRCGRVPGVLQCVTGCYSEGFTGALQRFAGVLHDALQARYSELQYATDAMTSQSFTMQSYATLQRITP